MRLLSGEEVSCLENYVKVVLYAYPILKNVGQDYQEHIQNKALLSYKSEALAERLVEYIAEEIINKRKLEWLKHAVEAVLERLDVTEKTLVAIRYFQKERTIKRKPLSVENAPSWSASTYFRKQNRLGEKVGAMLREYGVTNEVFENDFAPLDIFRRISRFVEQGKDRQITENERKWVRIRG